MIKKIEHFFRSVSSPLIVVSSLPLEDKEIVVQFLTKLNAPVYLEGISGIREEPRLQHLRVTYVQKIWELPIDGIFRLGGVPTPRFWRDLETKQGCVRLLSYSHLPWSGVSWGEVIHSDYHNLEDCVFSYTKPWFQEPIHFIEERDALLEEFPKSEPGIMRQISEVIPEKSLVYLGNSLPIREWDLAASDEWKRLDIYASRGMNGIDGQLSTFLGMSQPYRSNWCILGDLTTLYDLAAPWILDQLEPRDMTIVVINNGGGMIFSHISDRKCLQNRHSVQFEHFAKMWNINYLRGLDLNVSEKGSRLIELVPCEEQTKKFWKAYSSLSKVALRS